MKSKHSPTLPTAASLNSAKLDVEDIIFSENIDEVTSEKFSPYSIHVFCYQGNCSFKMSDKNFQITAGDFVIWTHGQLVSEISTSPDFVVAVLYISYRFLRNNMPNNDYDVIGMLSLLQNPVLPLIEREIQVCQNDFEQIKLRLSDKTHHFYAELLGKLVMVLVLDLYDIHVRIYKDNPISEQNALLLRRFIELLENGVYIKNREVAYYADKLFVTPKYLSEVCKKVSGYSTTFWIDRFAITEITRKLRNKNLTLTEIAEELNFSSISYFSRYVQRILGVSPSRYRQG